ncbi:hypothetical protein EZV62_003323 [Acer yangbiense]|uniref:PGG domain-containing protein n=1 Tax=Acer yangbiense TaxID=1000413 RepID=A0A5C7IH39_9ROSI|nr:hypothetical protein EZV62_003323 [Acer yangbiense]
MSPLNHFRLPLVVDQPSSAGRGRSVITRSSSLVHLSDRGFSLLRPQPPQKTHLSTDRGSQPLRVGIACPIAHHEKSFDAVPVQCSYSWIASDMLIWWRTGSSQAAAHHAVANDQRQKIFSIHLSKEIKHDGAGKTPRELFSETHNALVEKGEKWMKENATSCSVVAALIIIVVFTAAFTVSGGMDSQGRPIFLDELSFKIFAIYVALALFSSTASV